MSYSAFIEVQRIEETEACVTRFGFERVAELIEQAVWDRFTSGRRPIRRLPGTYQFVLPTDAPFPAVVSGPLTWLVERLEEAQTGRDLGRVVAYLHDQGGTVDLLRLYSE